MKIWAPHERGFTETKRICLKTLENAYCATAVETFFFPRTAIYAIWKNKKRRTAQTL